MRTQFFTIFLTSLTMALLIIACSGPDFVKNDSKALVLDSAARVKRGEYLVTIGGCDDCHSPKNMGPRGPEIDMERRLSGYPSARPLPQFDTTLASRGISQFNHDLTAAAGPWGVSFAGNITGDATGIGNWSLQQFTTALRKGKWKGIETSRPLLPPMPWFNTAKMTDEDIEALFLFLKSTKPVENVVPAPKKLSEL
jgi:hypothetical protein